MNKKQIEGEWDQLVGSVKKTWGKLTDNDIAKVKGQKDKLVGLIEEKYGDTKEAIEKKIDGFLKKKH